jgi:hypothetical protein
MGRFTVVHFMAQRAIGSPVNIYVKEGKVVVSFPLHGKLNILVDTVQVVKEVPQPVWCVQPDNKSVVHITEPAEGLISSSVECYLLEVFQEEVGNDQK